MKLYVVHGRDAGDGESILLGVYDNSVDAYSRQAEIQYDEDITPDTKGKLLVLDYVYIEQITLGEDVCVSLR